MSQVASTTVWSCPPEARRLPSSDQASAYTSPDHFSVVTTRLELLLWQYLSSLSSGFNILFLAHQLPRRLHALLEQHDIGERPDTARYRCDRPGNFTHGGKIDIAHNASIGQRVDAHVDDDRSGLDHLIRHHPGTASCRYQHIRLARQSRQIRCARVADRHGRVFLQKHHTQRLSHHVAATDHHHSSSLKRRMRSLKNLHHRCRRRRQEAGQTEEEIPGTARTDAIDILTGSDRIGHHLL